MKPHKVKLLHKAPRAGLVRNRKSGCFSEGDFPTLLSEAQWRVSVVSTKNLVRQLEFRLRLFPAGKACCLTECLFPPLAIPDARQA